MCNRAKDGSLYWVKTIIVPFLGKNGKPNQYVAIREDVTSLKQGKIRIERLSKIYRALSEVNQAIVRMENESSLFPLVCRMTVDFGDMALAWIGRPDKTSERLQPVTCYGNRQDYLDGIVISLNPNCSLEILADFWQTTKAMDCGGLVRLGRVGLVTHPNPTPLDDRTPSCFKFHFGQE